MIAIKGHLKRGREVIQLLESLGGINKWNHTGESVNSAYYIDHCNNIYSFGISEYHGDRKIYTLEEFEKSFPFKIGDKVIHKEFNDFFEVISFDPESPYPYRIKGVCEFNTRSCVLTKWQPKMKEERFVTLTLDKAKEWYKKGGELREIALQAFTEKELNPLPRSWEEFCRKYEFACLSTRYSNFPLKYDTLFKLEQLRDCWRQGWEPNWDNITQTKYCICCCRGEFKISTLYETRCFLTFPTREIAEEFLECFRDLIEQAGDLI